MNTKWTEAISLSPGDVVRARIVVDSIEINDDDATTTVYYYFQGEDPKYDGLSMWILPDSHMLELTEWED